MLAARTPYGIPPPIRHDGTSSATRKCFPTVTSSFSGYSRCAYGSEGKFEMLHHADGHGVDESTDTYDNDLLIKKSIIRRVGLNAFRIPAIWSHGNGQSA